MKTIDLFSEMSDAVELVDTTIAFPNNVSGTVTNSGDLPEGWGQATIKDFAYTTSGGTPSRSNPSYFNGEIPWIKSGELKDGVVTSAEETITSEGLKNSNARLLLPGTLLLAMYGATTGKLGILGLNATTNQAVCSISLPTYISNYYLFYYLLFIRRQIIENAKGGAQPNISQSIIREIQVSLPPFAEQVRIVAAIEECLEHVNAARERLNRVPALLKKFRQSVLSAAYSGKLTADWRDENPIVEPVTELLARIRAGRKAKEGAKFKDVVAPDTTELSELPESWEWTTLKSIAELKSGITKGQKFTADQELIEVPYLRVANVQRGYLDLSEIKYIAARKKEVDELTLKKGDILFNEGGDRDKLGRGWIWEGQLETCIHQNHVFRGRLLDTGISPYYVSWYGNSVGSNYFIEQGKQTVNLASLSITRLGELPLPIPPKEELSEIVRRIESLFSLANTIEKRVQDATARTEKVTQSVLARAFRGELVETEAEIARREGRSYEPASEMLKNLAENSSTRVPKRKNRRE